MPLQDLKINQKKAKDISQGDSDEELLDLEEEFEDDNDEDLEDDTDVVLEDDVEDNSSENEEEDDAPKKVEEDSDEEDDDDSEQVELSRRASERVRQVVAQKNAARAKLIATTKEKIDTENRMIEQQKKTVETSKVFLSNHIEVLKKGLKKAHEESNHEDTVDFQERLNKAQLDLAAFESWKAPDLKEFNEDDFKDIPEEKEEDEQKEIPGTAKKWFKINPWFRNPESKKDKERIEEAVLYSAVLERKGITMDSPEYFKLIDKRLKSLGLAEDVEDDVQLSKSSNNSENNDSTGRKKSVVQKRKITQTVQGVHRGQASSSSQSQNKKRKTVTLSKEQQHIADTLGISHRDYALELLKLEEAEKRGERMVKIYE